MELLTNMGVNAFVVLILWFLVDKWVGPYVTAVGQAAIAKRETAEITDLSERVKHCYTEKAEDIRARHQLRLAALDQRLAAHQQSFSHWLNMYRVLYKDELAEQTNKCRRWWEDNCLYLEPKVRDAFADAVSAAETHSQLQKEKDSAYKDQEYKWKRDVEEQLRSVNHFPDVVFAAISLPPLSDLDKRISTAESHSSAEE
jgi:hypothetical protein